eukprot:10029774-Alexandrium_andersonii.AAC.1
MAALPSRRPSSSSATRTATVSSTAARCATSQSSWASMVRMLSGRASSTSSVRSTAGIRRTASPRPSLLSFWTTSPTKAAS